MTAQASPGDPRRIDVHHHLVPDFYVATLADIGVVRSGGIPFPKWTPERSLALMDEHGIETAMLSLSSPGVYFGDDDLARSLARQVNEFAAGLVDERPQHFGFFAAVPMPLVDASIAEATHALDELRADGVVLLASSDDLFLGDPRFDPLLVALDERRAVVFVHPNVHSSSQQLGLTMPGFLVEFLFDTTRAVANLLWNGAFERFPNIRWIIAHAGGTVPFLPFRLSLIDQLPGFLDRSPRGALHYLRQLHVDTALSPSPSAMSAVVELLGDDKVLFGSDFPFAPEATVEHEVQTYEKLEVFTRRENLDRDNALRLFPRLAAPGD